jgi:hypothetical protein
MHKYKSINTYALLSIHIRVYTFKLLLEPTESIPTVFPSKTLNTSDSTYVNICIWIHEYIHIYVYLPISTYVYTYKHKYISTYASPLYYPLKR